MRVLSRLLVPCLLLLSVVTSAQPWKEFEDSAKLYRDQKKPEKALEYYVKAGKELRKDSSLTPTFARNLYNTGVLLYSQRQYARAEPYLLEATQTWEKTGGKETANYASGCNSLALLYERMEQFEKAEQFYLETKQVREKVFGKLHPDYAQSCNNAGLFYYNTGEWEKAEPFWVEGKQVREQLSGKQHKDYLNACTNLAILYQAMGQYAKAEPLYREVKETRGLVTGTENQDYADACNSLAIICHLMGHFEEAESFYGEAKLLREKLFGRESEDYASSANNLAVLYQDFGQYTKAEQLVLEARQIRQTVLGTAHPEYIGTCNNLATLCHLTGDYEKAETFYLETIRLTKKHLKKSDPDYAGYFTNLAVFYHEIGQYEKAKPLYVEAREIRDQILGKDHPDYAFACDLLGSFYQDLKQFNAAEPLHLEARKILETALGKEHPDYAEICTNLAVLYDETGRQQEAESLYKEVLRINEKALGKDHPTYARNCTNLAVLYRDLNRPEEALQLLLTAKKIREQTPGPDHPDYIAACNRLANTYRLLQRDELAFSFFREALNRETHFLKRLFRFTSEKEKQSYLLNIGNHVGEYLSFISGSMNNTDQGFTYDILLANRNLVLTSSQQLRKAIYSSGDSAITRLYRDWVNTKTQLAYWLSKPIQERYGRDSLFEDKATALEKELARSFSGFEKLHQTVNGAGDIQKVLKDHEAAIEFSEFPYYNGKQWTGETRYIALVLRKDKPVPELVPLFEKKKLDSLLNYKGTSAGMQRLNSLYSNPLLTELVWKPVEEKLTGISRIYFSAAGLLHKISLAALPLSSTETISDRYELVQLNTTAAVTESAAGQLTNQDKIQLFGAVQYDADPASMRKAALLQPGNDVASRSLPDDLTRSGVPEFYYLRGTGKEISGIQQLAGVMRFPVKTAEGLNATEESFKTLNGINSPAVLHIATHGFFFPDPRAGNRNERESGYEVFRLSNDPLIRSGLALAGANNAWKGKPVAGVEDGILTAYEVSNMYLPHTKLAVLSACETGLGDIRGSEGVYGLQRAFKMAGVQHLVMSLWKVPDAETSEFMEELYKNLFTGKTIQDAFSNAQGRMKNKYRSEPYKWAAWILIR